MQRLATRGVVLLFNAVHKAQKAKAEAAATGMKAPKLSKASFIAELKAASAGSGGGGLRSGGVLAAGDGGNAAGAATGAPGWGVLGQGFPGLGGGSKMKDWDKGDEGGSEEGMEEEQLPDADSSGDEGGDGDDGW